MDHFLIIGSKQKNESRVENGVMRLDEDGDEEHNNKPRFFTYSKTYDTNRHLRSPPLFITFARHFCMSPSFGVVTCRRHMTPAFIVIVIVHRSCLSFIVHRHHAPSTCFAVAHHNHYCLLLLSVAVIRPVVHSRRFSPFVTLSLFIAD